MIKSRKTKGRNCYIIYVEEKHKDITIKALASRGLYAIFHDLARLFDSRTALLDKLKAMRDVLDDDMRISDLYYVGRDGHLRNISRGESFGEVRDLHLLTGNDLFTTNEVWHIRPICPSMYELCQRHAFETVLILPIGVRDETFGYLICAEPKNLRIWQSDECAIMFFVARMLAAYMQSTGERL